MYSPGARGCLPDLGGRTQAGGRAPICGDAANSLRGAKRCGGGCHFRRDTARGLRVARAIKSGICHVNGPTVHDEAQMPFGGTKASGYGRFGGKAGIDSFTELRWITIETQPGHFPI